MEPLAALGLAANVVQLVDAAFKAFNLCHQVYSLGGSIKDTELQQTANELTRCYGNLLDPLQNASRAPGVSFDMIDLGTRCRDTAKTLSDELSSLRGSSPGSIRGTVTILIRKKKKATVIQTLKTRLDEHQKVLDTKVLVDVRSDCGFQEFHIWLILVIQAKSRNS